MAMAPGCQSTDSAVRDSSGRPLAQIASTNPRTRAGFGPPPYKYWRIVGDVMPPEAYAMEPALASAGSMQWEFVGGRPVVNEYWSGGANAGGRVVSIACHPSDPSTAYAASASGGIWKTVDAGANWLPMSDNAPSLNHGAVAIDPLFPDTVGAGTGEYTTGSSGGLLLRSLDAGQSWAVMDGTLGSPCSGLAVVPGASAAMPAVIHATGDFGYRRSTNGGTSFTTPLAASCSSLAVDATDPNRVYVGVYGGGIRRSTNGGQSFTLLSGGLPTSGFGRVVLAMGRSNPQRLYAALVSNSTSGLLGFYRSDNGGDSWTQLTNTPDFPRPQGWYDLSVGVDPLNADHLYCGGVSPLFATAGVIESIDGGASWTEISGSGGQIHPDQHWISFGADGVAWFGCDGGVWRRSGAQWTNCNATLAAIQNYTIAQHPADPSRMMAGTQDNGMAGTAIGALAWPQLTAGDGGFGAYDASSFLRLYTTYVYLRIYRVTPGGTTDITGPWSGDSREWIAPMVADPNVASYLYGGTNRLWRNANAGSSSTWTVIGPTTISDGGRITAIEPVDGVPGAIWVGNSQGGVWRTLDDGANWTSMDFSSGTYVSAIDCRPGDANDVCVSRSNVSEGANRVVRGGDGGPWVGLTGQVPAGVTAKSIAVDWGRGIPAIYMGSGAGIYATFSAGASWIKDGPEFPNVNIGQLEIDPVGRTVVVGTYGRGAWRAALTKQADVNADGVVDGVDLAIVLADFGAVQCGLDRWSCRADANADGAVNGGDIAVVLGAWGL